MFKNLVTSLIMGKETDLLEASRTGNVAVIEKILSQRARRSGPLAPLASLRRSANPSCQDVNGDTPLHHAALNGHREAVQLLLQYEASANIMDNKGCFPLHLAAWSGNAQICKILLSQGPSHAKVNEQNTAGETALHCAAQYGHTDTVVVLLEHHADPTIRNIREESPLDLSAQYGRLEAVQLLLKKHPNLLLADQVEGHSALHLASRNGHKLVVQALLETGFDINRKTETGSALHEAALFGKQDVVKLLIDTGIKPNLTDGNNRTALEVNSEQKSQISVDIGKILLEYIKEKERLAKAAARYFASLNHSTGPASIAVHASTSDCVYDDVPLPRSIGGAAKRGDSISSHSSNISALYTKPNKLSHHSRRQDSRDSTTSEGSSVYDTPGPAVPPRLHSAYESEEPIYDTPLPVVQVPRLRPRRKKNDEPKTLCTPDASDTSSLSSTTSSKPSSPSPAAVMNRSSPRNSPTLKSPETPKKPPRRKTPTKQSPISNKSPNIRDSEHRRQAPEKPKRTPERKDSKDSVSSDKSEDKRHSGTSEDKRNSSNSDDSKIDVAFEDKAMRITEEDENKILSNKEIENAEEKRDSEKKDAEKKDEENTGKTEEEEESHREPAVENSNVPEVAEVTSTEVQDSASKEKKSEEEKDQVEEVIRTTPSSRPPSLEFGSKRSSREVPLSPTGYEQPPTPDHPPPSPMTAALGIQEKINPKEKRRSRDMETITELMFLAPQLTVDTTPQTLTTDEQTETEVSLATTTESPLAEGTSIECCLREPPEGSCCDTKDGDFDILPNGKDPFIEDCRECLTKGSLPSGQRRIKSQIYDNIIISAAVKNRQKRVSAPGIFVSFDPVEEREEKEDNITKDAMGSKSESSQTNMDTKVLVADKPHLDDDKSDSHNESLGPKPKGDNVGKDETSPIDENEEWAKIAAILSSCGGRMSASDDYGYFEKRLQQIFADEKGSKKVQSVGDWLDDLGLPQYENALVANGFDDMDFMGSNVLEDTDLMEVGVISGEHRKKMLQAALALPKLKPIAESAVPETVDDWLQSLRLSQYLETFHRNGFNTMDRVRQIWELELNTVLDMSTLGHRKRILASLKAPPEEDRWSQGEEVVDIIGAINWNLSPLSAKTDDTTSRAADIDLFRDYTGVRPLRGSESDLDDLSDSNGQLHSPKPLNREVDLNIRPPHLAHSESPIRQWRHRPEVLIKGCCNYSAQYLGSTLVQQLQGTESTKESINKMKKSTETISKIPTIILSISFKGVKFIDAKSKRVICEHEIGNIFCACQDGDHLNYFAYITKDLDSERHFCHVFCVRSTELATEIILTLGEAFEVAYQMALKERGEEVPGLEYEHTPGCQNELEVAETASTAAAGEIQSAAS